MTKERKEEMNSGEKWGFERERDLLLYFFLRGLVGEGGQGNGSTISTLNLCNHLRH